MSGIGMNSCFLRSGFDFENMRESRENRCLILQLKNSRKCRIYTWKKLVFILDESRFPTNLAKKRTNSCAFSKLNFLRLVLTQTREKYARLQHPSIQRTRNLCVKTQLLRNRTILLVIYDNPAIFFFFHEKNFGYDVAFLFLR